jgi:hypothetical protein
VVLTRYVYHQSRELYKRINLKKRIQRRRKRRRRRRRRPLKRERR